MRGVFTRPCGVVTAKGLSPRMRGGSDIEYHNGCIRRFIPACAGCLEPVCHPRRSTSVYPRVCGVVRRWRVEQVNLPGLSRLCGVVQLGVVFVEHQNRGLSPHVRGISPHTSQEHDTLGFIPACAGWVTSRHSPAASWKVYPRVCGVFPLAIFAAHVPHGFIPAYAGCLSRGCLAPVAWRVYPRVCGVFVGGRISAPKVSGLSPHVRGVSGVFLPCPPPTRFIPAYAGCLSASSTIEGLNMVYPRVCGVFPWLSFGATLYGGLSPRMRGV